MNELNKEFDASELTIPSEMSRIPTAIGAVGSSRRKAIPRSVTISGAVPRISG